MHMHFSLLAPSEIFQKPQCNSTSGGGGGGQLRSCRSPDFCSAVGASAALRSGQANLLIPKQGLEGTGICSEVCSSLGLERLSPGMSEARGGPGLCLSKFVGYQEKL